MGDTKADDDAETLAFFSGRLATHGNSAATLDWGSPAAQERRFDVLAGVGLLRGGSVLDVGCGLGHLAGWLERQGGHPSYVGVDLNPELATRAAELHPRAGFADCPADRIEEFFDPGSFSWVVASGLFYRRTVGGLAWMAEVVRQMQSLAVDGVAFNTLTADADGSFVVTPAELVDMVAGLGRYVIRADYAPHDATVYLYPVGETWEDGPSWRT